MKAWLSTVVDPKRLATAFNRGWKGRSDLPQAQTTVGTAKRRSLPLNLGSNSVNVDAAAGTSSKIACGAISSNFAAAHKQLANSCGFMPSALPGILPASAGAISTTSSGATSFNCAAAKSSWPTLAVSYYQLCLGFWRLAQACS